MPSRRRHPKYLGNWHIILSLTFLFDTAGMYIRNFGGLVHSCGLVLVDFHKKKKEKKYMRLFTSQSVGLNWELELLAVTFRV